MNSLIIPYVMTDSVNPTSSPAPALRPQAILPAGEQHVLTFPLESSPAQPVANPPAKPATNFPAKPDVQPDAKPPAQPEWLQRLQARRAEKRERWQTRRAELHLLHEAKKKEREHEQLVIDKKRHEQEFARRYRRERYLLRRRQENPPPEPPDDILSWPPEMFRPPPERIRRRAEFNARRRRMQKTMRRPPLRKLTCRNPTRDELLSAAIAVLYEHGEPNRNLLRTVRWRHGDLPDSALPEKIRAKHRPAANDVCREVREELSRRLRADSISCRRTLRRGRILMQNRNYRWTRFPAAGAAGLDNLGRPAGEPAKMYNPFLGLESLHPRIVGFEGAIGFPERMKMLRRIVGLENVRGPEEAREISSASRDNATGSAACSESDARNGLANRLKNRFNDGLKDGINNRLDNGLNGESRSGLKDAGASAGLRPLRRGFTLVLPLARRRFVLPVSAAGPPGEIIFPRDGGKEVLLCFPGGGLRVAALCSLCPRMLLRSNRQIKFFGNRRVLPWKPSRAAPRRSAGGSIGPASSGHVVLTVIPAPALFSAVTAAPH